MTKNKPLGKKILYAMLAVVSIMLLLAVLIFTLTMKGLWDIQTESNRELNQTTGQLSSNYLTEETIRLLQDMAVEKATIADEVFSEFEQAVCEVAYVAEQIYANPLNYAPRSVPLPDASTSASPPGQPWPRLRPPGRRGSGHDTRRAGRNNLPCPRRPMGSPG